MGGGHTRSPLSAGQGRTGLCVREVAGLSRVYCGEAKRNKHGVGRRNLPFSRNCSWGWLELERTDPRLRASSRASLLGEPRTSARPQLLSAPQNLSLLDLPLRGGASAQLATPRCTGPSARLILRPVPGKVN